MKDFDQQQGQDSKELSAEHRQVRRLTYNQIVELHKMFEGIKKHYA